MNRSDFYQLINWVDRCGPADGVWVPKPYPKNMTRGEFEVAVPSFFAVNVDFKAPEKGKPGPRCQLPVRVSDCHLESCLMGGQAFHWLATGTLQWYPITSKQFI